MRDEILSTLQIIRVICDTDQMATLLKSSFKNCNSSYHKSASFIFFSIWSAALRRWEKAWKVPFYF